MWALQVRGLSELRSVVYPLRKSRRSGEGSRWNVLRWESGRLSFDLLFRWFDFPLEGSEEPNGKAHRSSVDVKLCSMRLARILRLWSLLQKAKGRKCKDKKLMR